MSRWVFAYGSLIWNPGFAFEQKVPARLQGYTRKLCVLSHRYRGTPDCLGLVFGLDRGMACNGVAYEVNEERWPATHAYLTERELITHIYKEVLLPVQLIADGTTVDALTYVVDPAHEQYAGQLGFDAVVSHVRQGHGTGGSCIDYVRNTAEHLAEMGISDPELDRVVEAL